MARGGLRPEGRGPVQGRVPARRHPRRRLARAPLRRRRCRRPSRLRDLRRPRADPPGQPRGQPQRLRSGGRGRASKRLVYASSVAAYGFHPDEPAAADRGGARPRQRRASTTRPRRPSWRRRWTRSLAGSERRRLRLPALHRRRPAGDDADRAGGRGAPASATRCRACAAVLGRLPLLPPVLPDAGVPIQLVHHDDVARGAGGGDRRQRPARRLQPRRRGRDRDRRHRPRDRLALGAGAGRRPSASAPASPGRLSFVSPQLEWATALAHAGPDGHRARPAASSAGSRASTPPRR